MIKYLDKEIVERALYKAWKTSTSKNNAMAYEVVVWGLIKNLKNKYYTWFSC